MKVVFFSNFLNHHQKPICDAFIASVGEDNFRFVATMRITQERIEAGYADMNQMYTFVVKEYEGNEQKKIAEKLALESDLMVFGAAPVRYQDLRLNSGKVVYQYCERPFKHGRWSIVIPKVAKRAYYQYIKNRNKRMYVLCAGAYVEKDLSFLGFDTRKCYKWGYFPEVKRYENIDTILSGKKKNSILWVARLIALKHPEQVIEVATRLKQENYSFNINIIGNGPLYDVMLQQVAQKGLCDCVHILGLKTNEEVRKYMEESEIFLFTSNKLEGWGAVLNESMNSGCVPVSGNLIGATPYLIKDGVNGLIYETGNVRDLYDKLQSLLDNHERIREMGKSSYRTITEFWNAENAVYSLFKLNECILNNKENEIMEGPCSNADH